MTLPSGVTALDARETSTENLIKALGLTEQRLREIEQQTEDDRVNPKLDDNIRAALIGINARFLLAWKKSEANIRAELKRRLH